MQTNDHIAIAEKFAVEGRVVEVKPLGEGNINETLIAKTDAGVRYVLQRKNRHVFPDVPAMMDNIRRVSAHIAAKALSDGRDPRRATLTLIPLKDSDALYWVDGDGEYWTMCLFIEDSVSVDRATTLDLAYKNGQGIGRFQKDLADFTEPLADILPGFHNIAFRFGQWDKALVEDRAGRVSSLTEEIGWIESRRERMMEFWALVENGTLPRRVTHNDTKIANILFDRDNNVLCAIDLDTCLSSCALNDVGDALRTGTNTGAEDDPDLSKVSMDFEFFKAYISGYLSEMGPSLTQAEKEWLPFAGIYLTYEQVLRFLMDYIEGDHYYRIAYPDHNLVRTRAQYKLLISMEEQFPKMVEYVKQISRA